MSWAVTPETQQLNRNVTPSSWNNKGSSSSAVDVIDTTKFVDLLNKDAQESEEATVVEQQLKADILKHLRDKLHDLEEDKWLYEDVKIW